KRKEKLFGAYNGKFFIRPDSPFKTFTGYLLYPGIFTNEINSLFQLSAATAETLVCIASAKDIDNEYRFVIVNGEVITGSDYSWDENHVPQPIYPDECLALAELVAKNEWQPDVAYTCDV